MKKDKLLVGIIVFIMLASLPLILVKPEEPREHVITVEAKQFTYTPNIIEVNKGDRVTIRFISTDVHHGLYIDGYELETNARPGQDGSITFTANETGKFTMRCSVTCGAFHPYMTGYLRVKPDYRLFGSIWLAIGILIGSIVLVSRRKKP
ncbi:cupredoxin domain-containing protein [Candidatus Methanoperedens nitratireducens]|uniref:Cytochrome c oxidase, subunit II n=1 Tax=Candidatus Methanoperedens nitratireducens TaxID=1392998 RepID=A0A284VRW7_9EURY|nr:cupredoxin domain-containing protein [Candidatus Methanoperedens nitroreducens]SNQ62031.1 Cytochrome c oxidase, subunit II [Candidatus Methanoperedens nitroreducens]